MSGPSDDSPLERVPRSRRLAAYLGVLAALIALVSLARRPPILDLPQLFDQVARFGEVVAGERSDLEVDWIGPNKAGALLVGIARVLGGSAWGPRLAVILVGGVWLAAVHFLAARAGRPVAAAIVVSPLLFGSVFYGGFFNFVVGIAALAYWVRELDEARRDRPFARIVLSTALGAALLYFAHVLWLLVGGFAVATFVLLVRFRPSEALARAAGVLPVLPLLAAWSRSQEGSGWQTVVAMMVDPLDRISSLAMASSLALGGLRHVIEQAVLAALLIWLVTGAARAVRDRGRGVHPFLLVAALVFAAVALLAPDTVDKTMLFAWRWGGPALALAILALPSPKAGGRALLALAIVTSASHALITASIWYRFDRVEMSGFESALARVPTGARLLAMNVGEPMAELTLDPFVHQHVYATTERDATVAYTFANLGNALVRWRSLADAGATAELVLWRSNALRPADLRRFSHLLVRCPPDRLDRLRRFAGLIRIVEGSGQWGLFEIAADVPIAPAPPAPPTAAPAPAADGIGGSPVTQRPASHQAPAASAKPG